MTTTWIPPSLVIPPPSQNAARSPSLGLASSGGAGAPIVSFFLPTFTIVEGSAEDTLVGTFQVDPDSTTLTLIDNPGGYFKIDGNDLKASGTPTDFGTAPNVAITVQGLWGGKITTSVFEIDVTQAPYTLEGVSTTNVVSDSGGEAFIHTGAAQGTLVATFSPFPANPPNSSVVTYELDVDSTGPNFQIVGDQLQTSEVPTTAGTYIVWFWGQVNGVRVPETHGRMNVEVGDNPT